MRNYGCVLCLLATLSQAHTDALGALMARDKAMNALKSMNTAHLSASIPGFVSTPPETQWYSEKNAAGEALVCAGLARSTKDATARFILKQEGVRVKITPNSKSSEMDYAERLLENPDRVMNQVCHMAPVPCTETRVEQTCEESVRYAQDVTQKTINVRLHEIKHRTIHRNFYARSTPTDLTSCLKSKDIFCLEAPQGSQDLVFHPRCEYLHVEVRAKSGDVIPLLKTPTCASPTLTTVYRGTFAAINVTEYWSEEDQWVSSDDANQKPLAPSQCVPESANACMDAGMTKLINGVPITRPCWGSSQVFRCVDGITSTCTPFINEGCSNTAAVCTKESGGACEITSKTFQCLVKTCYPDKEVCLSAIGCADGSCDTTHADESDDTNEGLSRLGALAGAAEDAAVRQTDINDANIFKGDVADCEKFPLGTRDCCTDKGFLEGLMHCPASMQVLQRAKVENRALALGHYKHHLLGTTHYAYCVFPTKLASIIQIQGRGAQLRIPFGTAEQPDCRGLTPKELEGIDFKALDLNAFIKEVTNKTMLPDSRAIDATNITHADALFKEGRAHD